MSNTGDGIWEKALGQPVEQNTLSSTINNYKYHHKINRLEVRNYMFSNRADNINSKSLWDFFGPNIFEPSPEGLYFAHYLFLDNYDYDKIYLALDASFNFVGPNTGELLEGRNYIQQLLLYSKHLQLIEEDVCELKNDFIIALFELGIKYGMNPNYRDLRGNTILIYMVLAIRYLEDLKEILEALQDKGINVYLLNDSKRGVEFYLEMLVGARFYSPSFDADAPHLSFSDICDFKDADITRTDVLSQIRRNIDLKCKDYIIKRFEKEYPNFFKGGLFGIGTLSNICELIEKLRDNSEELISEIDEKFASENFKRLIKKA